MPACFIEIAPNVYVNTEQVTLIRQATRTEAKGKEWPLVVISLQNDQHYYIKGYVQEVIKKLKESDKCGS